MMYLLGQDKENNFIFIEVLHNNDILYSVFHPVNMDEFNWADFASQYIDDADVEYLYDLCCRFDCRPSDLRNYLAEDLYESDARGDVWVEDIQRVGPWRFEELDYTTDDAVARNIVKWYYPNMDYASFKDMLATYDLPRVNSTECLDWLQEHVPHGESKA